VTKELENKGSHINNRHVERKQKEKKKIQLVKSRQSPHWGKKGRSYPTPRTKRNRKNTGVAKQPTRHGCRKDVPKSLNEWRHIQEVVLSGLMNKKKKRRKPPHPPSEVQPVGQVERG